MGNRQGFLVYKCRWCRKETNGVHSPDALITMREVMDETESQSFTGIRVKSWLFHVCDDGKTGVADLVGILIDDTPE